MRSDLARAILGCGYADLEVLDGVGADWGEVADRLRGDGIDLNFNNLMREVMEMGIDAVRNASENDRDAHADLDFSYYLNYLDTHLNGRNREFWMERYPDAVSEMERITGFHVEWGD